MIRAIHKRLEEREEGFTLIELLVVVIIIGILAAIAIPTFLQQRERAWERTVQSDLRNNAVVLEDFFSENGTYVGADAGFRFSDAVTEGTHALTATTYCIAAFHDNLGATDGTFNLLSTRGTVQDGAC